MTAHDWLTAFDTDADLAGLLAYADWLEDQDDPANAALVRQFPAWLDLLLVIHRAKSGRYHYLHVDSSGKWVIDVRPEGMDEDATGNHACAALLAETARMGTRDDLRPLREWVAQFANVASCTWRNAEKPNDPHTRATFYFAS